MSQYCALLSVVFMMGYLYVFDARHWRKKVVVARSERLAQAIAARLAA